MTSRPSTAAPILAVLAVALVTLGAYVGGYFWLGEYHYNDHIRAHNISRYYFHDWQRTAFRPAAWVEAQITGEMVILLGEERLVIVCYPYRVQGARTVAD
jgi:hypothetical protein